MVAGQGIVRNYGRNNKWSGTRKRQANFESPTIRPECSEARGFPPATREPELACNPGQRSIIHAASRSISRIVCQNRAPVFRAGLEAWWRAEHAINVGRNVPSGQQALPHRAEEAASHSEAQQDFC